MVGREGGRERGWGGRVDEGNERGRDGRGMDGGRDEASGRGIERGREVARDKRGKYQGRYPEVGTGQHYSQTIPQRGPCH